MAIPKNIFQTFKTDKLPWITRRHISKIKKLNPEYTYHFYDDKKILEFLKENFSQEYIDAYESLNIGAAKADFFRYAVLYIYGGVYLDIDSGVIQKFSRFILENDIALISPEEPYGCYIQWALVFDKGHPFLKKTMELMLNNIQTHRFPHDVHGTTGPTVYTKAVMECIAENPEIPHRFMGSNYEGNLLFKYKMGKLFLYHNKSEHWKRKQKLEDIIKPKKP